MVRNDLTRIMEQGVCTIYDKKIEMKDISRIKMQSGQF
jgi:hypothetical protein